MTRGLPLPRPSRFLLLAAALVALAVLVVGDGAPPAQAQSATVLVSNMGQTARSSSFSTSNIVWAVRFDTGSNSAGYTLTSVEVVIGASPTESQRDTIRAELWSDNSGPDSKVYDLTVPAHPISAGTVTFTAPANATLSPDTVYWVVPYTTGSFNLMMGNTDSDGEDSGAAPGWSIGNASRFRQSNSPTGGSWGSQTLNTPVLKVQVNGPAADPLALSALTAESSTDGSNFAALTLEPEFHADDTEYWAAVTNDVTHVRLTPTLADTNSSVKVGKPGNLATVASGSASGAIALEAGVNEIRAAVTDADGFTRPYYVYVSRAASDQLASNIGQVSFGGYDTDGYVYAPGFTTGSNTGGYTLTSIEAYLLSDPSAAESGKFRAELWSAATGGGPDSKLYDLTVPSDMAAGVVSFAAPANTTLAASTTYHAVFYTTDNTAIELDDTDTTDDDPGGATGWSIGNTGYNQEREEPDATETWDTSDYSLGLIKIAVKGTEALSPLDLSDLTAESSTDGSNFTALTLNPDFAADTTEYRAAVANDVTHVRLTPTLANTNSSVKVGKSGGTLTTVSSGSASGAIPVDVGANEITVEVTDTNSNTQNYIVTVYRTASDLLVTNLGQEVFTRDRLALTPVAQGFTTGSHAGGYSLRSINATFEVVGTVSAADAAKVRAELWSAVASGSEAGQPDEKLIDLTPPTSISAGVLTFTPPSNAGLGPNTTFLLLLYLSSDLATGVEIRWTATDQSSEDLGQTGWSVADEVFSAFDIVNVGRLWTGQANVQHVSVNGAEADPVALTALTLETSADGSTFTAVTGAEALAPAFDAATAGYRATVGNDVTHVRLTATEAGGGRVGIGTDTLQLCDSGTPCDPIPLQVGDTNISVGAIGIGTLDYTVIVRRVPAGSEWWATLTPVAGTNNVGCNDVTECGSALTDNVFTLGGTDFYLGWITDNDSNSVTGPNALEIGLVDSTGGAARAPNDALKALNFCVGPGEYALTTPSGVNNYAWANANLPWTVGAPVSLSIGTSCGTDGGAAGPGPGDLDPAFSADSALTTAIGSAGDRGFAVARQDDGKIVVAGYSYNGSDQDFAVVRYTSGGVLDPTFGNGGMVVTDFGASRNEEAYAVAIQDDGKIVVAGQAGNGSNWDFAVVRYTADGELDTSFSTDGKAAVHFEGNEYARAVAIQSDGKIVLAGWAEISGQNNNFALARFNADGTPDTSFSTDGKLHTRFGSSNTAIQEATAVAIQSDGKIVVAGNGGNGTNRDFLVARYTTAGALDTSFGADNDSSGAPDGWRLTPVGSDNDRAYGVAVDGSGNIVLAGETDASGGPDVAVVRYTSTGALDTSFDSDGKVTTAIGSAGDRGRAVRIDANGKIVVGGYSYNGSDQDFAVVRYDTDGSLDTDFHSDGKATAAVGTGNDEAHAMVLDADGNILLAGHSVVGSHPDIALAAFTAGGEPAAILDRGITTTAIGSGADEANAVAVDADGKIVLAGYSFGTNADFALVRYNEDGSLDTGFDSDGRVTTAIGSGADEAEAVAVQPDGKIVAAGYRAASGNDDFAVVRYNADGSLDTGFGTGGKVTTAVGSGASRAQAIAVQSDGKIVAAGYGNDDFAVVRYNADGTLDTGFGTSGVVTTAIGSGADRAHAMAVQSDGKIVLAGYSHNGSDEDFAVVRYNADGTLDTGFDSDGKVTTAIGSGIDIGRSVAIQSDGKIVVAGHSNNGSIADFALVRYNADGSLDTGFGTGGKVTTATRSGANDLAYSVAVQADGKIVLAGFSDNGSSWDLAVARYNSDGSLDTGFGSDGVGTTPISGEDRAYAAAIQPDDNKIVLAGYSFKGSTNDFAVARYLPGEVVPLEEPPAFLVSNLGQVSHSSLGTTGEVLAQGFTTGSNSGGYTLTSIEANLLADPTAAQSGKFRAELWSAATSGGPGSKLYDLTVPPDMPAGLVSFAAPANTTLTASTKYYAVFYTTDSTQISFVSTNTTDEDADGAAGWSIENTAYGQTFDRPDATVAWDSYAASTGLTKIAVKGAEAQEATLSSNADLSNLTASSATSATGTYTTLALTPATFNAATTAYTATVASTVSHVKLTPTVDDTGKATVAVFKQGGTGTLVPVTDTQASPAIELDSGSTTITVRVTAENSTTKDYTVTVTQEQTLSPTDLSALAAESSTDGSNFTAMTGAETLAPAFDAATTGYRATVGNGVTHVRLTPTLADAGSSVQVGKAGSLATVVSGNASAAIPLDVGDNAITVRVTDTNGNTRDYTVTVRRVPAGSEWWATLTPVSQVPAATETIGCYGSSTCDTALSDNTVTVGSHSNSFDRITDRANDFFQATFTATPTAELTALQFCVGDSAYSIDGNSGMVVANIDVGWTAGVPVSLSLSVACAQATQAPGAVTNLAVDSTSLDMSLTLSWTAPSGVVTGYDVEYKRDIAPDQPATGSNPLTGWVDAGHTGIATKITISSLTNHVTFDVRVRAVNSLGSGPWAQIRGRTSRDQPGPVTGLTVVAGYEQLLLSWTAPVQNVTGYQVEYKESTASSWTAADHTGIATRATIDELTNGTAYDVRVRAVNRIDNVDRLGESWVQAQGTPTDTVVKTLAEGGPGKGHIGEVDEHDAALTVAWGKPATGLTAGEGSAVTAYDVEYKESTAGSWTDAAHTGLARFKTITGLTNGAIYDLRVRARTEGSVAGEWSDTAQGTPRAANLPPQPRAASATGSGALDTTFDTDGKATADFASFDDRANAVAVQDDGKIVVAGYSYQASSDSDFALVRYNADGSLDAGFGTGGRVTTGFGNLQDLARAVAVQRDGRIVVAGRSGNDVAVARYTRAGALDASFGDGGKVTTSFFSGSTHQAYAVALQPDGKIVVAGNVGGDGLVVRYTRSGTLDASFGDGGKVVTDFGSISDPIYDSFNSMALRGDGRIVAAGERRDNNRQEFVLARYTADGKLDDSFGDGGMVTTASSEGIVARAVLLLPGGEVVAAGYDRGTNERFVLARYTHYGALDLGFGNGGRVFTHVRSGDDRAYAMALQPDGKILLAGYSHGGGNKDFAVARYDEYGRLDPAFGTGGKLTVAVGSGDDRAHAMAVQPDGKIVLAGYSHNGSNDDFALVRFVVEPRKAWIDGIEAGNASLTVNWGLPLGDPTGYDVEYKASAAAWTDAGHADATRTVTIGSLTNGTTYDVRVRATNGIGAGAWSDVSQGTPSGSGAQGAEGGSGPPTAVTLSLDAATVSESAGQATLTVTLDAPAPEGGIGGFLFAGDDGTAFADVDFTMPFEIFIPGGQRSATATVSITDDDVDEADETVVMSAFFDLGTAILEDKITLTITDDDTAGVTVSAASGLAVDEGGTATYTVVLDSQPTADVTITASSGDTDAVGVSPASHTFTASGWNQAQTFTVSGVADTDGDDESVGISHGVTSDDARYGAVLPATVSVAVSDTTQQQGQANQAPTVDSAIPDATIPNESGTHQVSLSGVFSDADSDALTVTAGSSDTALATVSVASDQSSLTVSAQARGTATITVTADDGNGGTVSDEFTVRVKAAPTVASAISDVSGLEAEDTQDVSLSGVFSDADGDALTFTAASSDDAIATVTVAADGSTLTLTGVSEGTGTITVTARDADGNTVSDDFAVSVEPASPTGPPTVVSPLEDISLEGGNHREISLSGVFQDPDGDELTFAGVSSNYGVASMWVDGSTLTVVGTGTGTATITVTAEDGDGKEVSDAFEVTVTPASQEQEQAGSVGGSDSINGGAQANQQPENQQPKQGQPAGSDGGGVRESGGGNDGQPENQEPENQQPAGSSGTGGGGETTVERRVAPLGVLAFNADRAPPGATITLTGAGFVGYAPLQSVLIAGVEVFPGGRVITDAQGRFTVELLVPGVGRGRQEVVATVGGQTASGFLVIDPSAVADTTTPVARAWAGLADRDLVVAHHDNEGKRWRFYYPRVPGISDLAEMVAGETYMVQVGATTTAVLNGRERSLTCHQGNCWNVIVW